MRTVVAALSVWAVLASSTSAAPLKGAGSSAASPLVAAWSKAYAVKTSDLVQYDSVGSTAGLDQLKRGAIQFALSDAWISVPDLTAQGFVQFPVMVEGIVPFVNVPGVAPGALKLTGPVLADIFLGKVRTWNDAALTGLNPGLSLPALAIQTVHRADGSGSTFILTSYLSAISPAWKTAVGSGARVKWPGGLAEEGSDAVVQKVKATPGAIGYVDAGRVRKLGLVHVGVKNKAGAYPAPTGEAFAAAAAGAPWSTAPAFAVLIVDQPGPDTWPIAGAVFAVMRREQDAATGLAILKFFDFALGDGAQVARDMGYVPLPLDVTKVVRTAWPRLIKTSSGASVWPGR